MKDFTTIDWLLLNQKERTRQNYLDGIPGWKGVFIRSWHSSSEALLILLIGVLCAITAVYINLAEAWMSDMREGFCGFNDQGSLDFTNYYLPRTICCLGYDNYTSCKTWYRYSNTSFPLSWAIYVFSGVLFGTCSVLITHSIAPFAAGSGIPEVKTILGGFVIPGFLSPHTLLIKATGLSFSVASGLYFGKEGPMIHIACCIANALLPMCSKYRYNEANRRMLYAAACASGVAVAYGAPIGGILFSLEGISYYFPQSTMAKSFFMAVCSIVTLKIINPFRTGRLVLFQVNGLRDWYAFEYPLFIIMGLVGGTIGAVISKYTVRMIAYRRSNWHGKYPVAEVAILSFIVAFISYPFPFLRQVLSTTGELVINMFRECSEGYNYNGLCDPVLNLPILITQLWIVSLTIAIFTITSFGVKIPAGISVPLMAIGAMLGRSIGLVIQYLQHSYPSWTIFRVCVEGRECITPGTYAIIGCSAVLAGSTRMTFSLVLIMFELTGAFSYVLPIMTVILLAKWTSSLIERDSFFDTMIRLNGYPFLTEDFKFAPEKSIVQDIMTGFKDLQFIRATTETTSRTLFDLIGSTQLNGFPVLSKDNNVIGYFPRAALVKALKNLPGATHPGGELPSPIAVPVHFQQEWMNISKSSKSKHIVESVGGVVGSGSVAVYEWMDSTPVCVDPGVRLEIVIELFKAMGLRYVLVTRDGVLVGLVTKKDLLRVD